MIDENHVFVHLVSSGVPMHFRLFLLRHAEVLRGLYRWTVPVLVPAPLAPPIRLFGQAARETLATPLASSNAEALSSVFRGRQRRRETPSAPTDPQLRSLSLAYGAPRFRAMFRAWEQFGDSVIWAAQRLHAVILSSHVCSPLSASAAYWNAAARPSGVN